ncbi:MAG: radical SAM protein, partial [Candidatus Nanoarchaeia archaeon]
MKIILDCYTDEPAGLGVPNYLGTYPRYLAGLFNKEGEDYVYLTIDDFRYWYAKRNNKLPKPSLKTDIFVYNKTNHNVDEVLQKADELIAIVGVHVPGKYLTAVPGTLNEVQKLIREIQIKKVLTGPAIYGSGLHGGKFAETTENTIFDEIRPYDFSFKEIDELAPLGADLIKQIPGDRVVEIESGRGCRVSGCSFCTEPLKNRLEFRREPAILKEVKELCKAGARHFRVGKQACYFTHPDALTLLKSIRELCPEIKTLHIDNVNPNMLLTTKGKEICKNVVKYCTEGNVAAFGVECWDEEVGKLNNLNTTPEKAYEAIKVINEIGGHRGPNGMPHFLPGINIIFGLI